MEDPVVATELSPMVLEKAELEVVIVTVVSLDHFHQSSRARRNQNSHPQ